MQSDHLTGEELDEAVRQAKQLQSLGAIILLVGVLVTVASYSVAGPGQKYIIAVGALIIGFRRFVAGNVALERLARMRSESESA